MRKCYYYYDKYFEKGVQQLTMVEDYNSDNTINLSDLELEQTLLKLDYLKNLNILSA